MSIPASGMRALLAAFQTKFNGSALSQLMTDGGATDGRLWPWGAPESVKMPYVTFVPGIAKVDYVMGTASSRMETIPVSFSVWLGYDTFTDENVLPTTLDYYEALQDLFDDCELADLADYDWSLVRMDRTGYFVGPDDDGAWTIRADYEVIIEEV